MSPATPRRCDDPKFCPGPLENADLRAHAIVASALCFLDAPINDWMRHGGGADATARLLDVAMTTVKHGLRLQPGLRAICRLLSQPTTEIHDTSLSPADAG